MLVTHRLLIPTSKCEHQLIYITVLWQQMYCLGSLSSSVHCELVFGHPHYREAYQSYLSLLWVQPSECQQRSVMTHMQPPENPRVLLLFNINDC